MAIPAKAGMKHESLMVKNKAIGDLRMTLSIPTIL